MVIFERFTVLPIMNSLGVVMREGEGLEYIRLEESRYGQYSIGLNRLPPYLYYGLVVMDKRGADIDSIQ